MTMIGGRRPGKVDGQPISLMRLTPLFSSYSLSAASIVLPLLLAGQSSLAHAQATIREKLMSASSQLTHITPTDVIYYSPGNAALQTFRAAVEKGEYPAKDISPLLSDSDPRIRSLAMVALFDQERHRILPKIIPLLDDQADTFPDLFLMSAIARHDKPPPVQYKRQTVGQLSYAIIKFYLDAAGFNYGPSGLGEHPGFAQYWGQRKNRTYCASWFAADLARAGRGTSPTPVEQIPAIKRLRRQIDATPEPDRTLTLLWLRKDAGSDALATEEELVGLARSLGHERILKVLRRNPPTDDPDIQPRSMGNFPYANVCLFFLRHAKDVLRPADAGPLLDQEAWERDYQKHGITDPLITAWWAVAAARLAPTQARKTLTDAYPRFESPYVSEDRLLLAETRWELVGEEDLPAVVDWYYNELKRREITTWLMAKTFRALVDVRRRDSRRMLKALVSDPRFDTLNLKSVLEAAAIVNSLLPTPVITPDDISEVNFPAIDFFYRDEAAMAKAYPKETKTLLIRLPQLRSKIRAAVRGME